MVELTGETPWDKKKPITTNTALLASNLLRLDFIRVIIGHDSWNRTWNNQRMFRKKQDADDQAVKVKQLAAEVEQLQAAIAEMSKLKTDKETKLENTMRNGSKWGRSSLFEFHLDVPDFLEPLKAKYAPN